MSLLWVLLIGSHINCPSSVNKMTDGGVWKSSDRTVNKQHNLGVAELEHAEEDMGRDPAEV
jgi:hypothetical protein